MARVPYTLTMEDILFITGPRLALDEAEVRFLRLLKHLMTSFDSATHALFGGPFFDLCPLTCAQRLHSLTPPAPGVPELLTISNDSEEILSLMSELMGKRDLCLLFNEFQLEEREISSLGCYALAEPKNVTVEGTNCPAAIERFVSRHGFEEEAEEYNLGILRLRYALAFQGIEDIYATEIHELITMSFGRERVDGIVSSRALMEMAKDH